MSTRLCYPVVWSDTTLDAAVKVLVDMISIYNYLTLREADYFL